MKIPFVGGLATLLVATVGCQTPNHHGIPCPTYKAMDHWQYPEYHFYGIIDDKEVTFHEDATKEIAPLYFRFFGLLPGLRVNTLKMTTNRVSITYRDEDDDLEIDSVIIESGFGRGRKLTVFTRESDDPKVETIMDDAQEQFEIYLDKIVKRNSSPLYDHSKK